MLCGSHSVGSLGIQSTRLGTGRFALSFSGWQISIHPIREGLGLTISEALWKKKPVIGSAAGGIKLQVIDG
jgi:glycosyltransferase involved in cell wall biosynthesis